MSESKIHFIMTGGTIDGFYDAVDQTARPSDKSVVPDYMERTIKPYLDLSFEQVCMKDSKDITDEDRASVLVAIEQSSAPHIIVTHGTDTMEHTAKFIQDHLDPTTNKIVLLTGSIIPLKGFTRSDSGFNLGYAIAMITQLDPGVYIAMNAKIFAADQGKKNFEIARFEEQ